MQPYQQVNTMVHQHMATLAHEAEARRLARGRGDDQGRAWRRPRRRPPG